MEIDSANPLTVEIPRAAFTGHDVARSKRQRRERRHGGFPGRVLSAIVWLWACTGTALLYAATPVEPQQDGQVAPTPLAITSAESAKSAIVTAIASEITVDGALNEEAWRTAPTIGDLAQREPRTGEKPTEHTEVTLLHDANYLYIGVMAYDSEPQRIIGTQMTRDANLRSDDRIEILLDTYRDQRNAFYFATNPAGALVDGLLFTNGQSNMNWDAIWTVRTVRTSQGWSAEFAIPFKSLSFPSGRTVWGFNVARYIQRKLEDDRWSGARLETQFFQVSEAGEITNLDDLTQGVGVDVRPFAGARWLRRSGNDDTTITGKPGLDVFYNFTPSLKVSATVNTDFGETEVDARQINLTRFSLFFPEKRAFFLENAGVFSFSETAITTIGANPSTCCQVIPFFSRRIGLLAGTEVPIDAGVKLTGRVGRTDVGVLDVRTRDVSTVPAKNFLVGRVKQNFLQQSYIGAIFTDGHPGLSIGSRTYGADVRLATSNLLGKAKNLNFNAYGLRSMNTGTSDKDASYGVSVGYPNDFIDMEFAWREVQDNFRPGLGFVSRRNVRVLRAGGRVHPRSEKFPLNIRDYVHGAYYTRFTRLDNGLVESSKLHLAILDWHFRSGDSIHALFSPAISYERVFAPFEISPGVVLPPGEYRFTRFRTIVMSAAKRRLTGSANWRFGNYWSGRADEVTTNVSYKVPPRFIVSLIVRQTFARLPQGDFTTRIVSSQVNYTASPFLSLSNLVQYDNRSRNLGWQSRIRWILQPGNDLFLVFTQGWIQDATDDFRFRAQDTKLAAKIQYTSRF